MAHFVRLTNSRWINADIIERVVWDKAKDPPGFICEDKNGNVHAFGSDFDPEELLPVVPGSGELVRIFCEDAPSGPTIDDIYVCHFAIVAWRIDGTTAMPITTEDFATPILSVIKMPDGTYLAPYEQHFQSLDAVKQEVLERAQNKFLREYEDNTVV